MASQLQQRQNYLRNLPLFGGVNLEACRDLAEAAETVQLLDGEAVYNAGETADALFILYAGTLRLELGSLLLNELGEGEHLGDMEFFDMAPRGCTVRAQGPCEVWRLPFDVFDRLRQTDLKAFALITMTAARQMSRRLRTLDEERGQLQRRLEQADLLN